MPKKGKKKGGKKKKGKKKKMIGHETPEMVVKRLMKTYERNTNQTETVMCPGLRGAMRESMEKNELLSKFILDPLPADNAEDPIVAVEPLINALRQERYTFIKALHIWEIPLLHAHVATIALLLEKGIYPIQTLELMDCLVEPFAIKRLAVSFNPCESLSHVILDYNEFGDEGVKGLCVGLQGNRLLISISMCYCDLGPESGKMLGHIASTTAVREMYLDGNNLECEGLIELIKFCAEHAEVEHYEREEAARIKAEEEEEAERLKKENRYNHTTATSGSETEKEADGKTKKKKKKKKGKKKKEPPPPPPVGPWIYKLHVADNGIDAMGPGGTFAPLICMRLLRKMITYSKSLEEVDLEDNLIGDLGGREILEALQDRKEVAGLKDGVKLRTTHRMASNTFNAIVKLGAGMKKKKKKGKKKKKK